MYSGLQWIWIENIKNVGKQLTNTRRRGRAKAIQRANDAGKGGSYDFTHVVMGHDIH